MNTIELNKIEYELISSKCINSKWCASFLDGGEQCECNFECKVKIRHVLYGYVYVVSESEYKDLANDGRIING